MTIFKSGSLNGICFSFSLYSLINPSISLEPNLNSSKAYLPFPIFVAFHFQLLRYFVSNICGYESIYFIDIVILFDEERTREHTGITKNFFDEYFKDRKVAYAYKLGKIKVYDEPKALTEFGLRVAPQSFAYAK